MKNKILFILSFIYTSLCAQTVVGVDTLLKSGPINKRINIVIIGDGYDSSEMPLFLTDATNVSTYLLNISPFDNYKNYFNVFAIKNVSPQSGVTHQGGATDVPEPASPIINVTNSFDTRFDNFNIHRLIASVNTSPIYTELATYFPNYDQVIILGNSPEYGGSGGALVCSSTNSASNEIVAHEMGHSFGGLADEYWAGTVFATEKPNMTADNNSSTNKWAVWLGLNAIGMYPYGTVAPQNAWFRPHQNCKMRYLNSPFCSVCKETIIEKIHSLTNPIDSYQPSNTAAVTYTTIGNKWFKGSFINPNPNTLKRTWMLNATNVGSNIDSVSVTNNMLAVGNNTLELTVLDTNILNKDIYHPYVHSYSVVWDINLSIAGLTTITPKLEYSVFPNPSSSLVNIKYTLLEESEIALSIKDINGRAVIDNKSKKQPIGEYQSEIDISHLPEGTYFLSIKLNNQTINNQLVITK